MTTESKQEAQKASTEKHTGDWQASDFFPPGSGWNQAAKPEPVDHGGKSGTDPGAPRLKQN